MQQSDERDATRLPEKIVRSGGRCALIECDGTLQVRQRECGLAVAAIEGAKQGEQRGVLRDRQELAIARRPAGRGEVAGEDADLGDKRR